VVTVSIHLDNIFIFLNQSLLKKQEYL